MRKGFTLIELIVVIAIIAILAAIIAPNAFRAIEKAKIVATVVSFKAVKGAAQAYYVDVGTWPYEGASAGWPPPPWLISTGLGFITDDGASGWEGPYLEAWPNTDWGLDFVYYYLDNDWDGNGLVPSHALSIRANADAVPSTGDSLSIPERARLKIDTILDDGDPDTGRVQLYANKFFNYLVSE